MPLVSVVMPVYNQEKYVEAAVGSVLDQTFQDYELIIVDDGSTDRTVALIEGFMDPRVRLIKADHNGFLAALKSGVNAAEGRWIARMDSDDICAPNRLERQISFLTDHPECLFVTTVYGIVTPNGKYLRPVISDGWRYLNAKDITAAAIPFCDPSTVFDKKTAIELGYDDAWENEKPLWYKFLSTGAGAVMTEPLYYIRWIMGSHSRGMIKNLSSVNYEIRKKYDPENLTLIRERRPNSIKTVQKSVKYYTAARDFKAARKAAFVAWWQLPLALDRIKLLIKSLGVGRSKEVFGPAQTKYVRVSQPF